MTPGDAVQSIDFRSPINGGQKERKKNGNKFTAHEF